MTIQGSSARITRLDADGQPTGPTQTLGAAMFAFGQDEPDELDDSPLITPQPWRTLTIEITALDLRMAYLLFGSRRIFGWRRPLAINGHEYRRRVRRR